MSDMTFVPLGDVADFVRGINFKPDDVVPVGTPGSVACMRTKNVQEHIDLLDVWGIDRSFVRRDEQILLEGDVLISSANSWNLVGKCSWIPALPWESSFGGFVTVLRAKREHLDPRYLYYWFSSNRIQDLARSFGQKTTNISNLNIERCKGLLIPLPSIAEQRRIAVILDKAENLRAKRHQAIAKLDALAQAIFLEMFGDPISNPKSWPIKPLTEACYCYSGGTPSKADEDNWQGTLPWFSPKDMKKEDLFDSQDHINEDLVRTSSLKLIPPNTVSIVVRGMILAHTFPVSVLRVPSTINQDMKALLPREPMDPQFLANCIRCQAPHVLQYVSESGHGTKRIDAEGLAKICIPSVPIKLQARYASAIAHIETIKVYQRDSLAYIESLVETIRHRAFNGAF